MFGQVKLDKIFKPFFIGLVLIISILVFSPKKEKSILPLNLKAPSQNVYAQSPFADPSKKSQPEKPEFLLVENSYLKTNLPPVMITPRVLAQIISGEEPNNDIQTHIVEPGESLWSIAQKYNLKIETIIWVNDIKDAIIKPGQELTILPVDGLIHIVKKGDTLEEIAEKYKADKEKILAFNEISSADDIFENQALIIPDGKLPSTPKVSQSSFTNLSTNNFYGLSHYYPYGQCTWWVAQKRAIPAWGNAKDWLKNAIASGFPVCQGSYCTPQVGAVISLKGNSYYGHVGYVENVKENKVVFSEMNYIGWGKMNYRELTIGDPRILGYIYKTF
jgi:surface antigen